MNRRTQMRWPSSPRRRHRDEAILPPRRGEGAHRLGVPWLPRPVPEPLTLCLSRCHRDREDLVKIDFLPVSPGLTVVRCFRGGSLHLGATIGNYRLRACITDVGPGICHATGPKLRPLFIAILCSPDHCQITAIKSPLDHCKLPSQIFIMFLPPFIIQDTIPRYTPVYDPGGELHNSKRLALRPFPSWMSRMRPTARRGRPRSPRRRHPTRPSPGRRLRRSRRAPSSRWRSRWRTLRSAAGRRGWTRWRCGRLRRPRRGSR